MAYGRSFWCVPRIACVYRIVNTVTGETYVGETTNYLTRKTTHFAQLRRGKHNNLKLQESFRKHGEKAFIIEVLERSPFTSLWDTDSSGSLIHLYDLIIQDWLVEREGYYFRELKACFNVSPPPRPCNTHIFLHNNPLPEK